MLDAGHAYTDEMIKELEKKMKDVYGQAAKEMEKKVNDRMAKYEENLKKKQQDFDSGKITKKDFDTWKKNQAAIIANKTALKDVLTQDLLNADKISADMINGSKSSAYAYNYNYGTYQIEVGANVNTSFVLFDTDTVERIIKDNPDLLPKTKLDIPKAQLWEKQKIGNALVQGILQGESIPKIAKRLQETVGMEYRSSVRNARTAMTSAQNAGRVNAYKRGQALGIDIQQEWLATLDNRTRHSHRQLDGERIKLDGVFSNKCRFPGDPQGPGHEVYNCRCTLIPVIAGHEYDETWKEGEIIDGLPYKEWKKYGSGKKTSFDKWEMEQAAPDAAIMSVWSGMKMSNIYNLIKAQNSSDANKFYKELGKLGKPSETWDKYLKGELDADELAKFEDILKKYLPDQNVSTAASSVTQTISKVAQDAESKLNIPKGNPMDVKAADEHKTNPFYSVYEDATKSNCQSSAFAYECRRQGYDVVALPKYDNLKDFDDIVKTQNALGVDQSVGWINKVTGKHPEKLIDNTKDVIVPKAKSYEALENAVGKKGERYTLSLHLEDGAHTVNIDRDANGALRIIDNQLGAGKKNVWTGNEVMDFLNDYEVKNIKALYRVDDCVPNPVVFNKVVVDSSNVKPQFTVIGNLSDDKQQKIIVHCNDIGKNSDDYYAMWKCGLVDDDEIDNILGVKKTTSVVTPKPSAATPIIAPKGSTIDTGLLKDKKVTQVYNEIKDDIGSKEANAFYKELKNIGEVDHLKQGDVWKKYLAGELDADDVTKIEKYLDKYKVADKVADKVIVKGVDDTDALLSAVKKKFPDVDNATDAAIKLAYNDPDGYKIFDKYIADNKLSDSAFDLAEKYFDGKVKIQEMDDYLGVSKLASTSDKIVSTVNDVVNPYKGKGLLDLMSDPKLKPGQPAMDHLLNDAGMKWPDYLEKWANGDIKDDVLDDLLLGKKAPIPTPKPSVPTLDFDAIKDKKMSAVFNEIKATDTKTANKFYNELKKMGKPSEVWDDYLNGAISAENQKKIEDILIKHYNAGGTAKVATKAAEKSDDLIKAEEKLKKAQDELAKVSNDIYSGIWKDDVKLSDYVGKKDNIAAKKIYYKDEIDKLSKDPSYKSWLSDEKKQEMIDDFYKKIDQLDDFETKGKEYAKLLDAVGDAKKEVQALSPTGFSPDVYTDKAKKDAKSFTNRDMADGYHRQHLDDIWDDLTDREKYGVWEYTRNSNPMNKSLSGYHDNWSRSSFVGYDKADWGHEDNWRYFDTKTFAKKFGKDGHVTYHQAITDTTNAIAKSKLPESTYLVRGSGKEGLAGLIEGGGLMDFDTASELLKSGNINDIKAAFEGQVIKNHAFTSTGIAKGTGFSGEVSYSIYAPAGTQGIYAEPQSYYGNTIGSKEKLYKKGQSYKSVGGEAEIIIQRGTEYRITNIEDRGNGSIHVEMEIVNQPDYFKYGDEDTFNNGATRHKK